MWTELYTEQELRTGTTGLRSFLLFRRNLMKKEQRWRYGSLCWELINRKRRTIFFSFKKIESRKLAVAFQGCLCVFFCWHVLEVQDQLRKFTQSMWAALFVIFIFSPFLFLTSSCIFLMKTLWLTYCLRGDSLFYRSSFHLRPRKNGRSFLFGLCQKSVTANKGNW